MARGIIGQTWQNFVSGGSSLKNFNFIEEPISNQLTDSEPTSVFYFRSGVQFWCGAHHPPPTTMMFISHHGAVLEHLNSFLDEAKAQSSWSVN